MYITHESDEKKYCLHIVLKEIPDEINKKDLLVFENDAYLATVSNLFSLLSLKNSFLKDWKLCENDCVYGFVHGEIVLRIELIK